MLGVLLLFIFITYIAIIINMEILHKRYKRSGYEKRKILIEKMNKSNKYLFGYVGKYFQQFIDQEKSHNNW